MSGRIAEFNDRSCDVLGISTDDISTHERWVTASPADGRIGALQFPLASDVDGDACKAYDVYVERQNLAMRTESLSSPRTTFCSIR